MSATTTESAVCGERYTDPSGVRRTCAEPTGHYWRATGETPHTGGDPVPPGVEAPCPEGHWHAIEHWTTPREDDRPLRYTGIEIGTGTHGSGGSSGYDRDWTRGVRVSIRRRLRGGYVVRWRWWSAWEGEGTTVDAVVCADADAVLHALRGGDDGGALRPAEQEALRSASCCDPALAAVAVEDLDAE